MCTELYFAVVSSTSRTGVPKLSVSINVETMDVRAISRTKTVGSAFD